MLSLSYDGAVAVHTCSPVVLSTHLCCYYSVELFLPQDINFNQQVSHTMFISRPLHFFSMIESCINIIRSIISYINIISVILPE